MPKTLLFLILLFTQLGICNGIAVQKIDTSSVEIKRFNADSLAKYNSDKDFHYSTKVEQEEGQSIFSYLLAKFLEKLLNNRLAGISIYDILMYGLILFAAVMLVIQMFKIKSTGMFARDAARIVNFSVATENIHEVPFEQAIEEAKAKGNYRMALRMLYLKTLKALNEAGLINWQKNKTNFEYYYELRGDNIRKEFHALTLVFESTWYGHMEISADAFSDNASSFDHFLRLIKKR